MVIIWRNHLQVGPYFPISLFIFEKGKKYLIKGSSGSGKSTLFKLILQEMSPDEGH
ncbi:ATP-binding cassette domain-containing protein [Streptococcus equi]|uniref:ATP-binding cassette domain-containing protein n=1 Tax=Streptococcus equi TaxID=1336 RepID=UPI001E3506BA|nr:ATP-binding cassette domain-containing protein [Streptococcus equi]